MIMITEDYVSFEVAKLLKEKGFDYQGFDYIDFEGEVIKQDRPTHQKAMKWLREMFHIHIRLINSSDESYKFEIYPMTGKYRCKCFEDYTYYSSYEEAVEAALKYSLENLI